MSFLENASSVSLRAMTTPLRLLVGAAIIVAAPLLTIGHLFTA